MLSKSQRLSKENFDKVFNFGTNLHSGVGYFKIFHWKDADEATKIACVAARKNSKKAVDRNRIRRCGYGAIEKFLDKIPQKGLGIIWFLPQESLTMGPEKLRKAAEDMIISLDQV
jgi:ribonuclease P protein component